MAADASIYSMIRPQAQQPGPLDQYAQGLQVKHLMGQGDLAALQQQQLRKGIADEEATAQAYKDAGGDAKKVRDLLYGRGLYKPAQAAEKAALDAEKGRADLTKTNLENLGKSLTMHRDQLAAVDTPQAAARWILAGFNDPLLSPLMQKGGSPEEIIAKIPQDPAAFQDWKMKSGLGIEKVMELTAPKMQPVNLGGTTKLVDTNPRSSGFNPNVDLTHTQTPDSVASNITTRRGQDLVNNRAIDAANAGKWTNDLERGLQVNMATGETRPITSGGAPVQRTPKMTEDQGKATGWLVQADNAYKNILKVMDSSKGDFFNPSKPGLPDAIAGIPSFGASEGVANVLRTGKRQQFIQASSSLSEALLRAATGAGVNKDEAAQKVRELTPQIGDEPEVRQQKLDAIPLYLESLKVRAGPGAAQLPGIVDRAGPKGPPPKDVPQGSGAPTTAEIDAELRRRGVR